MPNRRAFLKTVAATAATAAFSDLMAQIDAGWRSKIGLELYTVRDILPTDYEGVLSKIAAMGYKEVEPADPYNNMQPKHYRALLDKYGLTMPSTHSGATAGPDLEKQLEGFQIMGLKYTEIRAAGQGGGRTVDAVSKSAALLNEHGKIAKKFGMKMLFHNHAGEFEPLQGTTKTQYDVLLAETDPELVAMQLDIGWATVAGQNVLEMFAKSPGRFELWHVKDAIDTKKMDPKMSPTQRQRAAHLCPVGLGDVDYKPIFAAAKQAGLKHFLIEQDNAAAWGDSVAAAKVSYQNLQKILS
jgi:sugar phosphate isomerase/epimerase